MSAAAARKGKFNKTKRGTGKHYSDNLGEQPENINNSSSSSSSEDEELPIKNTPSFTNNKKQQQIDLEIENPNRIAPKNIKLSELKISDDQEEKLPMNRKDKEAAEAERKKAAFWKAQLEGKTDKAKSDLARLAIIKKQREDAAKKRLEQNNASSKKEESLLAGKGNRL